MTFAERHVVTATGDRYSGLDVWQRRVFVSSWLAYAAFYFCRKNISVLMPLLWREQNYSNFQFANIIFAFSLAYAAGQFVNGHLSDRFGGRRVVTIGALVSVGATAAAGVYQNPTWLVILELVNGLGQACGWSGILKIMAAWFVRTERGIVMAWWGTCYVLGGFLATAFATFMITNTMLFPRLGWRRGMFGPALVLLVVAVFFAWRVRDDPRDVGLSLHGTESLLPRPEVPAGSARSAWGRLLKNPNLQAIAVMYFLLKLARYSFLFWLPLYFSQRLRYSDQQAGYTSSLFELVGVVGPLVAGYASDRLLASRRFPVGAIMLWALGAICLVQPLANTAGFWGTAAAISVIGILVYGPDSLMSVVAVQDLACGEETARALGFVDGVGSCGQLVSAYVVALFVDAFGWDHTFSLFAVLAVLAGGVLALRWGPEKRARQREAAILAIPLSNLAKAEE